ncbi:hypothetical protein FKW77_005081 [Venturia effusa]|uniref:Uncharacterized protein n=1 Tax=Venturia effusa TaxID=50376 RepID=A0A517LQ38_9PEZI|nr:hypothetical protein FKW77_005081 [Venturia effusa]
MADAKKPTSFITLPRELRQKILAETFNANDKISETLSPAGLIDLAHIPVFKNFCLFETAMAKQATSFLSLPRELRQKIIFNTFDYDAERPGMVRITFMDNVMIIMGYEKKIGNGLGRGPYVTNVLPFHVKAVDAWSATLKQVHAEMGEDVDYVFKNSEWLKLVRSALGWSMKSELTDQLGFLILEPEDTEVAMGLENQLE